MANLPNEERVAIWRAAEARVVRWDWVTAARHSHEPAHFETHNFARGRLLPKQPTKIKHHRQEGFDSTGMLVVTRHYLFDTRTAERTVDVVEPGGIASYYMSEQGHFFNARWFTTHGGRITAVDGVYSESSASRRYGYDDQGRVTGYEATGIRKGAPTFDARDIEYDAAGDIATVYWRYEDGRRTVYYERPVKTETLAVRRKALVAGLANHVAAALERLAVSEPAYALCVHYTDADYKDRLPPEVGLGTASYRTPGQDPALTYDPTEWDHPSIPLTLDEELAAMCRRVNADIHINKHQKQADALMADLATALGRMNLPIRRTPDFACYAVNHDRGDFEARAKAAIKPAKKPPAKRPPVKKRPANKRPANKPPAKKRS